MPWRLAMVFVVLLAACGLAWPGPPWPDVDEITVCRGYDFSTRPTCLALGVAFTDGVMASGEDDHCDAAGQDGENQIDFVELGGHNIVDDGDAPAGSVADADSIYSDGLRVGELLGSDGWDLTNFTLVGWWKREVADSGAAIYAAVGDGLFPAGETEFTLHCATGDSEVRASVSGTWADASDTGPGCAFEEWVFVAMRHNAGGSGEIRVYSSESTNTAKLVDCDGAGRLNCNTDPVAAVPTGPDPFLLHNNSILTKPWIGNIAEFAVFGEAMSDGLICEYCRCGALGNVAADRAAICNDCRMGSASRNPWPKLPWPGS